MHLTPPADAARGRRRRKDGAAAPLARDPEARIRELEDEVADLRAELERSERRMEAMKAIQQTLGSKLEPESLLRGLVARTTELLEADRSTLFLVDAERDQLVSKILEPDAMGEIRMPRGVGLAGWVAAHGKPIHIRDAYADERFNREVDRISGYRTRCMLVWPVRRPRNDEVIGVVQVLNKLKGTFDTTDERLLDAIASSIGVAIEVMTLYREAVERGHALERVRAELELLYETERAITEAIDLEAMLEVIAETALARLAARSAIVYLLEQDATRLAVCATAGSYRASLKKVDASIDDPVLGDVVKNERSVVIEGGAVLRRGRVDVKTVAAVPIVTPDAGTIGVLELLNRRDPKGFSPEEIKALSVVAAQAGRAIWSERQRAKRELASRLATIGKMLSGVVHDLRTPMTLISGYTKLMAGSDDAPEREGYARDVQKQIEVMTSMTKDLLAFAKGEQTVLVRKVYLQGFMAEMTEHLGRLLDGTGVTLEVNAGYRGAARFDETKLRRVFHNIARNAVEAMPGGGEFRVSVDKRGDQIEFVFADTGPGIPKALDGRIFEAFATSGKAGGTGLGLAMVKRIAEEHRGSVAVESSPDTGTKLTVLIPVGL